ncbi:MULTISPECIES: helix-turn-helix transcriptional regulator [unclassified Arsenophonus]|uniref:helix-turn-helix transcriptional regulator n=1 Tax=unclassified Arsenophonus TaxID=2627083 RepID=UPI0028667C99|nr:helix-turn-helix transcriptional regulator [Arsenophonus sp.]MDR5611250.1 helix-turn-helix transcriptional regulator [Arsenophonus sp.]MDR5615491.1 helix-turn-helix transcriptional regulator [Arsenophonus sp.]
MNKISCTRKSINVTQQKLADTLGWKQSRIGNYESGIRTPDLVSSRKIVNALNLLGADCTLDSLFPPDSIKAK